MENKIMRTWRIRSDLVKALEDTSRNTGISQTQLIEDALDRLFAEPWLKEVARKRAAFRSPAPNATLVKLQRKKLHDNRVRRNAPNPNPP
jgi:hypothetical protein